MYKTRFGWWLAPLGALLAFAGLMLALGLVIRGHPITVLSLSLFGGLLAMWYLYHVEVSHREWLPQEWQLKIEVLHSEVRPTEVDRIRRYFTEDESEILWISHKHVLFLLSRIWVLCVLGMAWLAFTIFIGDARIPLHSSRLSRYFEHILTSHIQKPPGRPASRVREPLVHWPHAVTIPWWVIVIPAILMALTALLMWAAWSSWFFIITDKRVITMQRPYSYLPFMNAVNEPFFWTEIDNAEVRGSDFRRRWGLAAIDISTKLQESEDRAIKNIIGLPHPDAVAELINNRVQEQKSTESNEDLQSSMAELTAAIRELPSRLGLREQPDEWPTQEL